MNKVGDLVSKPFHVHDAESACAEAVLKNPAGKAFIWQRLREWHVVLIRSRGQFLGWVGAANLQAAEAAAAKTFNLNDWQRRRLLLRECRN